MSETARSEDLRRGLEELARGHRPSAPDSVVEEVWKATRGELPSDQTRELINRSITEPELAEAFRLAAEIQKEMPAEPAAAGGARSGFGSRLAALGAVAAAVIAVVLLLPVLRGPDSPASGAGEVQFRNDAELVLASPQDGGIELRRDALELTWTAGPEGTRYDLEIAGVDLAVLHRAEGLTETRYTVPADAVAGVEPGDRLLWGIEATEPDGSRTTSRTFVVVLQ
ncbi:hypothetical protein ABI59_06450 [Acidobacteria bacterium Mor1]|nr:hypothetical protein ABI59_06450 [Acidobacteria bacterium Mor1]